MNKLTLIGTPLGNIEDISIRQLKALFELPYIFAEDTRNHIKLKNIFKERFLEILDSLEIKYEQKQYVSSYREQNHSNASRQIISLLKDGVEVGLATDAGMPTISDPGSRLVEEVLKAGFEVDVIPGVTAIETALAISGLPTDKFLFLGFLPRTKSKIQKILNSYQPQNPQDSHSHKELEMPTVIIYESPFRVIKTLEIIAEIYPEAQVAACNDLTKKFQKVFRGNVNDIVNQLKKIKVQGEWVIIAKI